VDNIDTVIELGRQALLVSFMMAAPMLITGLVVGLIISILQAATQVQEQTLSFIPKIVGMMAALFLFLPWILTTITGFTRQLIEAMPSLVR
jgi:flagellar biosynthetic protein FliQ